MMQRITDCGNAFAHNVILIFAISVDSFKKNFLDLASYMYIVEFVFTFALASYMSS